MAIVLTDGSAASAKALDLGTVPNLFLDHETDQLILVHGWSAPAPSAVAAKDLSTLNPIAGAVEHIAKSRVAATTLNYKIEMVKLPPSEDAESTAISVAPAPAHPKGAAPGQKGGKAAPHPVEVAEVVETPKEVEPIPTVGEKIAEYVSERAQHFGCDKIVLGVGSGQQGKNLVVGSVAKEVFSRFRASHHLFFLKQSGPLVRPAAAMRMNVLVIPGSDLSHLRFALSLAKPEKKNDRVGVTIVVNNGKPKPQEGVLSVAHGESEDGTPSAGDVGTECAKILAEHGLNDGPGDGPDAASQAADTFPLIQYLTLDPTNHNATPKVDEVGNQAVKFFSAMKLDFVVVPPPKEGLAEAFILQLMSSQKPHVISVADPQQ